MSAKTWKDKDSGERWLTVLCWIVGAPVWVPLGGLGVALFVALSPILAVHYLFDDGSPSDWDAP